MLKKIEEIDATGHNISDVPMEMLDGCSMLFLKLSLASTRAVRRSSDCVSNSLNLYWKRVLQRPGSVWGAALGQFFGFDDRVAMTVWQSPPLSSSNPGYMNSHCYGVILALEAVWRSLWKPCGARFGSPCDDNIKPRVTIALYSSFLHSIWPVWRYTRPLS